MVRATFAGFSTALSALRMNQKQLDIVAQNIANMNTEGYTRQALKTSSINYENPTSFYMNENDVNVGFGVSMDEVYQMRDIFLDGQYRTQNAKSGYNESVNESLDSLAAFLDETEVEGLRASLDDIQTSLTNMQDISKVQDPVYEGEFMSRVQAFTDLLNSAAQSISDAETVEYQKLDGTNTNENGAVETINDLLSQIGALNTQIKKNQLLGNPALELQDERNLLLDELSSYIPIEVENYSESYTVNVNGEEQERYKIYNYDSKGNITGRSDWPEELRVKLVYYENDGENSTKKSITLVEGSTNGQDKDSEGLAYNVGKVAIASGSLTSPLDTSLTFTSFKGSATGTASSITTATGVTASTGTSIRFNSGSVQASLDMLSSSGYDSVIAGDKSANIKASNEMTSYSYDYYMDRLNHLAQQFSEDFNSLNYKGTVNSETYAKAYKDYTAANGTPASAEDVYSYMQENADNYKVSPSILLINKSVTKEDTADGVSAANIGISKAWVNGEASIGLSGFLKRDNYSDGNSYQGDATDTVTEMLHYMTSTRMTQNRNSTTYSDFMNNVSTVLATDANANDTAYKINSTVLAGIDTSRDQLSGVSLDEEAASMMTYNTSYSAAARLMTTLDEMLQTLLNIGA